MNCSNCHALMGAGNRLCPACGEPNVAGRDGSDGDDTIMLPYQELARAGQEQAACPRCHSACRTEAGFCTNCGQVLGTIEGAGGSPASPGPHGFASVSRQANAPATNRTARFLFGLIFGLSVFIAGSFAYVEYAMNAGSRGSAAGREERASPFAGSETLAPGSRPEIVFAGQENKATAAQATAVIAPAVTPPADVQPKPVPAPAADLDGQVKARARTELRTRKLELRREETMRLADEQKRREDLAAAQTQRKHSEQEDEIKHDPAKPVDLRAAWQQACSGVSAFQRIICVEKARWQHCRGKWDTTPECVSNK